MEEIVMSIGHGYQLLSELIHDHVVSKDSVPTFESRTQYTINEDGEVVMSPDITLVMVIKESSME